MIYVRNLCATAEAVEAPVHPSPAATPEETEIVLRWLEAPGVRIVEMDGSWSCPVGGAGGVRALLDDRRPSDVSPFDRDLPVAG
jgi:DNA polymerase III subunit epsilon